MGRESGVVQVEEGVSWYVLTTPSLCYAPPTLPPTLPIAANSSEATTITVVDPHPYPECAGDVGSNAKGGSRLFEPLKLSNYFGTCLGHMLGNQGFVHQDVAVNQVHAEEGADVLDYSGEIGNGVLSTPGFMPTTTNFASKGNKTANATVDYAQGDNGSLMTCNYPKSCEDGIGSESGRDLGDPLIASGKGLVGSRYGDAN